MGSSTRLRTTPMISGTSRLLLTYRTQMTAIVISTDSARLRMLTGMDATVVGGSPSPASPAQGGTLAGEMPSGSTLPTGSSLADGCSLTSCSPPCHGAGALVR